MSLGRKIKDLRLGRGLTQAELAERMGVHTLTLALFEQDRRMPGTERLAWLAEFFGVSMDELMDYESRYVQVPLVGYVSAGTGCYTEEDFEGFEPVPRQLCRGEKLYGLRVSGDSMYPQLQHNDVVLFRPYRGEPLKDSEFYVLKMNDDEGFVKRLHEEPEGLTIISCNAEEYLPKFMTKRMCKSERLQICGVVVRVIRDL